MNITSVYRKYKKHLLQETPLLGLFTPIYSRIRFDLKTVDYLQGIKYLYFTSFFYMHIENLK